MTNEEALAILKEPDRIGFTVIKGNSLEDCEYNQKSQEALNMAIKALERSKVGHWIDEEDIHYGTNILTCSNCKSEFQHIFKYNYCPNCGTRMKESEDI